MKKIVVVGFLALIFLVMLSQDLWKKWGDATKSSTIRVRRSISEKADVRPSSKKPSRFVYAKSTCNIRKGPGTTYAIIRRATEGERLEYVSRKGSWYKLKVAEGKPQEWVHKNVVILPGRSKRKPSP